MLAGMSSVVSETVKVGTVRDDLENGSEGIQVRETTIKTRKTNNVGGDTFEIGTVKDNLESGTEAVEVTETDHSVVNDDIVLEADEVTETRSKTNRTANAIKQHISKDNHELEDSPLSFNLHPPYIRSEVEEFVFSPWYFLVLYIVNRSSSLPADITSISSEISESLSSKLSVPSSVFLISTIVKYSSSSPFMSVNLSLVSPIIPNLHHRLCNLSKDSPFFWIRGTKLELYQVRHEKNQHIYVTKHKEVSIFSFFSFVSLIFFTLCSRVWSLVSYSICFN
jgi:hypothetical protein